LAPHVTVAMDHKQQIYDVGCSEVEIIRTLGLRRSNLTLLDAFRCCPYIVRIASEYIPDLREREAFLNQTRTAQTDIQTPLLYEAKDFDDERDRLIEVLRERQIVDRTIAILFALNRQVEGFARGMREAGILVETRKTGLNFASPIPKLITIHSAKGLTFDSVIMPRLVVNSFAGRMDEFAERLFYVGFTRATKWLYLSTVTGKSVPALSRVRKLAELSPPVVTLASRTIASPSKPTQNKQLADDELLDIL
jgi:superfamily I DNA/RNA helicase